ncbi:LacI family DNA-binding transcriptional regulator [Aggregatilineales bacterium SYSU G02658]
MKRVTIEDVARQAGVSIATVSRVVSGSTHVAPMTTAKVQAAINMLGYKPNPIAKHLAGQRTNTIGLIVDEIVGDFFQPMLRGIEQTSSEHGYDLLIHSTRMRRRSGSYPVAEHNTDGIIVFGNSLPLDELRRLYIKQFPMVLMHQTPPSDVHVPCVTIENKRSAQRMVDYLIEQRGYTEIAFLRGPEGNEDSQWRELGFRESMAAHGLKVDDELIGMGGFEEMQAHHTVTQWVRQGKRPRCIFAADDDSALGVLRALKEAGLRVPQDVAVVGFDDIRIASYLSPALTTVRAPIEQVSRVAVETLIQLLEGETPQMLTLLPTELIIRESCGYSA